MCGLAEITNSKKSPFLAVCRRIICGLMDRAGEADACAETYDSMGGLPMKRIESLFFKMSWLTILSLCFIAPAVQATVNVTFTATAGPFTQNQFIADTTTQYSATVTPSPYFANTYSVVVSSRNATQSPVSPGPLVTLDTLVDKQTRISTWTFVQGMADGMGVERYNDLTILTDWVVKCSSPSYFNFVSTPAWSVAACQAGISKASGDIWQQNFSTVPIQGIPQF